MPSSRVTYTTDVIYASDLKAGDVLAAEIDPKAPARPVQLYAAPFRIDEVTVTAPGQGTAYMTLRSGTLVLTRVRGTREVLVIRDQPAGPSPLDEVYALWQGTGEETGGLSGADLIENLQQLLIRHGYDTTEAESE